MSLFPPCNTSCGFVAVAISNAYRGVLVPIPNQLLRKYEFRVDDVAMSDPTVKLFEVVAMSDNPSADEVMIEFPEKNVLPVPPLAIVFVNAALVERQVPEIA